MANWLSSITVVNERDEREALSTSSAWRGQRWSQRNIVGVYSRLIAKRQNVQPKRKIQNTWMQMSSSSTRAFPGVQWSQFHDFSFITQTFWLCQSPWFPLQWSEESHKQAEFHSNESAQSFHWKAGCTPAPPTFIVYFYSCSFRW